MIVNRQIWVVREGHTMEEAMALFKEWPSSRVRPARVLRNMYLVTQSSNTLIFEFEYDDLLSMVEQWRELVRDLRSGSFMDRWLTVCESNSHTADIWTTVE